MNPVIKVAYFSVRYQVIYITLIGIKLHVCACLL